MAESSAADILKKADCTLKCEDRAGFIDSINAFNTINASVFHKSCKHKSASFPYLNPNI